VLSCPNSNEFVPGRFVTADYSKPAIYGTVTWQYRPNWQGGPSDERRDDGHLPRPNHKRRESSGDSTNASCECANSFILTAPRGP